MLLSEYFDLICTCVCHLHSLRLDLWLLFRKSDLLVLFLWWCQVNRFTWASFLCSRSDKHFTVWLLGCNSFKEFFLADFLICIQVNAPDDRKMFLVRCLASLSVKESFDVLLVDILKATVIYSLIGCVLAVALSRFKLLFEVFCVSVHLDFH